MWSSCTQAYIALLSSTATWKQQQALHSAKDRQPELVKIDALDPSQALCAKAGVLVLKVVGWAFLLLSLLLSCFSIGAHDL
jgi:hypothetical protein